jgi:hypothetical protein
MQRARVTLLELPKLLQDLRSTKSDLYYPDWVTVVPVTFEPKPKGYGTEYEASEFLVLWR